MRRLFASFGFTLLCAASAASASLGSVNAEQSSSRPMDNQSLNAAREYSRDVGREVLKEELGVDLNALRFQFDPRTLRLEKIDQGTAAKPKSTPERTSNADMLGIPQAGLAAAEQYSSKLSLTVDQRGDLMRLRNDNRDIPLGVQVSSDVPLLARLTALQTRIWVPFSWRDELKATAVVPLNNLNLGIFKDRLDLRSDYTNKLGVNQVQAGLGTQWKSRYMGLMDVDYDYSQRYGQGLEETVHWLKLKRDF